MIRPGLLTTVQDLGRFGYQRFGVVAGGVMDNWAQRLANAAVGNDEREALGSSSMGTVVSATSAR